MSGDLEWVRDVANGVDALRRRSFEEAKRRLRDRRRSVRGSIERPFSGMRNGLGDAAKRVLHRVE